jgi:isopenicillin N synthase-like dioxygenase
MRPTVPSIDFKPFLHGSASDRQRIASEIDKALSSVGFIQLHNHGIEPHKIDACLQWVGRVTPSCNTSWLVVQMLIDRNSQSRRLFALSESGKGTINPSSPSHNRGYSGIGNEKVRDRMCMKENFDCGNPEDHERQNSWPTEELLPGFRHFTEDFFQVRSPLSQVLHNHLGV